MFLRSLMIERNRCSPLEKKVMYTYSIYLD